jgi:hypothetical protein
MNKVKDETRQRKRDDRKTPLNTIEMSKGWMTGQMKETFEVWYAWHASLSGRHMSSLETAADPASITDPHRSCSPTSIMSFGAMLFSPLNLLSTAQQMCASKK